MKFERDPRDRYYRERLAGSTLASLVLHALLASFLFAMIFTASQEAATESVQGGEVVTIERRTPVAVPNQPAATQAAVPITHVPRIAPVQHAPLAQPQTQRLPQNRHELARETPNAPPNPRPIPQRSPQPNPQPTQNVYEVQPRTELPAAPVNIPTVAPIAVAVKTPPSAAPSPAPTAVASAVASPKPPVPTSAPTAKAASPAPVAPSAAPTAAAVAARSSAAPNASPAPAAHPSSVPAARPGVPSPSPTNAAAVAKTAGTAPSPGPKGTGSPGPQTGPGTQSKPAPARPVEIPPTPKPAPKATATPRPPPDINARLRAMLPNNPVNPSSRQYTPSLTLHGSLEPTPPPEVLAKTKYLYRSRGGGSEARVEMWVTSMRKAGPTTMCTGWLVRYPYNGTASHPGDYAPVNGTQISVGGGGRVPAVLPPVVEGIVTEPCEGRLLVPFAASPAPSP